MIGVFEIIGNNCNDILLCPQKPYLLFNGYVGTMTRKKE